MRRRRAGGRADGGEQAVHAPSAWPPAAALLTPVALPPQCRIAAHGKKLTKGKVLQVNIGESWCVRPHAEHAGRAQALVQKQPLGLI